MDHPDTPHGDLSRRSFLKKSSLGALAGLTGIVEIRAAQPARRPPPARPPVDDPIGCALIGFGPWGREIAATLGRIPEARLLAVCDTYDVMLTRAERAVPGVATHADYRAVLDDPAVQAVLIATPTHRHRQIALDALAAGKNVYCEAPMAASIDEARAIARAARAAEGQIFQVGHLFRSNPLYRSVFQFIRSGALGTPTMARSQWHAKQSWRRPSPNAERQREQNWRLDPDVSLGLIGEEGIHQLDPAFWFLQALPEAVTGSGQIMLWNDGRTVPDTIQAIFQFPGGLRLLYDATLTSSFDSAYDLIYGNDSTVMVRDSKAWMFKEVDAPMLGWEVYARKDTFYKEKGIALVANATKLDAIGQDPAADDPNVETPLFYALKEFMDNHFYGPFPPAAGYEVGFRAAVVAARANEAILNNTTVRFEESDFAI